MRIENPFYCFPQPEAIEITATGAQLDDPEYGLPPELTNKQAIEILEEWRDNTTDALGNYDPFDDACGCREEEEGRLTRSIEQINDAIRCLREDVKATEGDQLQDDIERRRAK